MIFPDADVAQWMLRLGIRQGQCSAESVVRLKHETKTTLSYAELTKKVYFPSVEEFAPSPVRRLSYQVAASASSSRAA